MIYFLLGKVRGRWVGSCTGHVFSRPGVMAGLINTRVQVVISSWWMLSRSFCLILKCETLFLNPVCVLLASYKSIFLLLLLLCNIERSFYAYLQICDFDVLCTLKPRREAMCVRFRWKSNYHGWGYGKLGCDYDGSLRGRLIEFCDYFHTG